MSMDTIEPITSVEAALGDQPQVSILVCHCVGHEQETLNPVKVSPQLSGKHAPTK